jgi:hypothetical protein
MMMNVCQREKKKVCREFSHTLFSSYVCMYSPFFRCSVRTSWMLAITIREDDDDDGLLKLMLKSSVC